MYCPNCRAVLENGKNFCYKCGHKLPQVGIKGEVERRKSRIVESSHIATEKVKKVLGLTLLSILIVFTLFSIILTLIGLVLLNANIVLFGGVSAGNEVAIGITMAMAAILSIIFTILIGLPEGFFTKIAGTGVSGLILILIFASILIGTLTFVALTLSIIFISTLLILKKKLKIQTSIPLMFVAFTGIIISIWVILNSSHSFILVLSIIVLILAFSLIFDDAITFLKSTKKKLET